MEESDILDSLVEEFFAQWQVTRREAVFSSPRTGFCPTTSGSKFSEALGTGRSFSRHRRRKLVNFSSPRGSIFPRTTKG